MVVNRFPAIELADENGLLAIGGDLEVETLLLAYQSGIFPWPVSESLPLAWFSPHPRGVLNHEDLYLSRKLAKLLRNCSWSVTFNSNFDQVIYQCAYSKKRKGESGTWITPSMINAYKNFHTAGYAYSLEVWENEPVRQLIGGLYGVKIHHFIGGESMFFLKDNASKVALAFLCQFLAKNGVPWIDTQMVTSVISSMGGKEISRKEYISNLQSALNKPELHFPTEEIQVRDYFL